MEGGKPQRVLQKGKDSRKGGEELVAVDEELLKHKIRYHPMFGALKETHLSCLKICSGGEAAYTEIEPDRLEEEGATRHEKPSDLDLFMAAYRAALAELAREIQKPMKEAAAFVELTYCLLDDVSSSSGTTGAAEGLHR